MRHLLAWVAIAFALFPALFVAGTSFNPAQSILTTRIIPARPSLIQYRTLFSEYEFPNWLVLAMVAIYLILLAIKEHLPWLGTHPGLVLVYLGGAIGFNTWFMKGCFDTIPRSLEESALVDGATPFQAFLRIILPLARPILAVVFVIQFISFYSEYLIASFVLKGERSYTLALGLYYLINEHYRDRWGIFAAGAVIGALVVLVVFYALQSQIVSGLTGGAVKE